MPDSPLQIALVSSLDDHKQHQLRALDPRIDLHDYHEDRDSLITAGRSSRIVHGNVRPHELPHLPNLQWVHATWTGVENLLFPAIIQSDVILTNTRGQVGQPMAEHALAGLLYIARDFPTWTRASANSQWKADQNPTLLANSTVLILGTGAIAAHLVPLLAPFHVTLWGVNSDGRALPAYDRTFTLNSVRPHLGQVDFVVMLLPAGAHTRHAMDRPFMQSLKPGAAVVNLSRGSVIDNLALKDLIDAGHLRAAVLDVTDPEPPPTDYPLFAHPRILLTGHGSWAPPPTDSDLSFEIFTHNLRCFLNNRLADMRNVVNKQAGY
jgi:phosphoglycerate dehydrogenase-like enzyme